MTEQGELAEGLGDAKYYFQVLLDLVHDLRVSHLQGHLLSLVLGSIDLADHPTGYRQFVQQLDVLP